MTLHKAVRPHARCAPKTTAQFVEFEAKQTRPHRPRYYVLSCAAVEERHREAYREHVLVRHWGVGEEWKAVHTWRGGNARKLGVDGLRAKRQAWVCHVNTKTQRGEEEKKTLLLLCDNVVRETATTKKNTTQRNGVESKVAREASRSFQRSEVSDSRQLDCVVSIHLILPV